MPPRACVSGQDADGARASRRLHWPLTVYKEECVSDPRAVAARLTANPNVTYYVFQREICPTTGRAHLQAFVAFKKQVSGVGAQKAIGDPKCHFEVCKGTPEENRTYCTEAKKRAPGAESGPYEHGVLPKGQGKRNDLDAVHVALDEGATDRELSDMHFGSWVRYNRSFTLYRALHSNHRSWQTEAIVYWGPPYTGKSRAASFYDTPDHTFWLPRPAGSTTAWWDGYAGHRTVVLDEFYGWLRRDFLQRVIDRTPLRVECKGSTLVFLARRVIFTSNVDPPAWYRNAGLGALKRRLEGDIGCVVYVGNDEYPTADSYRDSDFYKSLAGGGGHGGVHWLPTSDDVALGAVPGQHA